ncbi:MAG TPA: aminotransferase class V-fold PLP-dependent enzyme [Planctomycetes bacterium]|nr:aminotransferase class V-fold PLP-dependent enzyme [Planctomycetota bacterium]
MKAPLVYWDHAATSRPKPPEVVQAIKDWFERLGVDASRGSTALHQEVSSRTADLRRRLGLLCGVPTERVILCSGATEAANLFLKGILNPGDRVFATPFEHNAVARPLLAMKKEGRIQLDLIPSDPLLGPDPEDLDRCLGSGPQPRLLCLNHASNVTGLVLDLPPLIRWAKDREALVLLDCAQTAGRIPLSDLEGHAYLVPGHKGLMGPPGVGALCLSRDCPIPRPLVEGGTGSPTPDGLMPQTLPHALEAGTPNTPGRMGLLAALTALEGREHILHQAELLSLKKIWDALGEWEEAKKLKRMGPHPDTRPRVAVLSLDLLGTDPHETAMLLEAQGFILRAGQHCAPWIHPLLGTHPYGTLRISPPAAVKKEEVQRFAASLFPY